MYTAEQANLMYDVLESECGATKQGRQDFVDFVTRRGLNEYRFNGLLGTGGKIYDAPLHVDCYSDDYDGDRLMMIERANKRLADLVKTWMTTET